MKPVQAYRRNTQVAWTRADMLLAIYDAAIASLNAGIDSIEKGDTQAYPHHQLRTSQLLLLLMDGIDVGSGEVAANIHNLCVFCVGQISQPISDAWQNARGILTTLRDGFCTIRDQANELEAAGQIPEISQSASRTVLHV